MRLCKLTFTIISSLPCLHTFWHAIPTSFLHFKCFLSLVHNTSPSTRYICRQTIIHTHSYTSVWSLLMCVSSEERLQTTILWTCMCIEWCMLLQIIVLYVTNPETEDGHSLLITFDDCSKMLAVCWIEMWCAFLPFSLFLVPIFRVTHAGGENLVLFLVSAASTPPLKILTMGLIVQFQVSIPL